MSEWVLKERDLKRYPHFDPPLDQDAAMALALDPARVQSHTFYPFMRYETRWNRFAVKGGSGKQKSRPIRYAARADAYILSRYRHLIALGYEAALEAHGLSDSILAYRRILCSDLTSGKCNIHFAKDAVTEIQLQRNCCCITLDISSFFESLDHEYLRTVWMSMINVSRLPADHFAIFKAITRYSFVEKLDVYERLGHYGVKRYTSGGTPLKGYLTPFKKLPTQLCTGAEFRQKIAGGDGSKSLIKTNLKPYGIPQGAPISDLLANMYLLEFDVQALALATNLGGKYMRYSDDILLILPISLNEAISVEARIRQIIRNFGAKLTIKEEKSSIHRVRDSGDRQHITLEVGTQGMNGFEYLGFRYDGRKVFIRDSTLSNLYRKVSRSARAATRRFIEKKGIQDEMDAKRLFDYDLFISRFGRVEDFETLAGDINRWTFWTYTKRAQEIFGPVGNGIDHQLRKYRQHITARIDKAIASMFS